MGRRQKPAQSKSVSSPGSSAAQVTGRPLPRWKLWCFRLTALLILPLLFAIVIELALRIAGVGEPASFLLAAKSNNQSVWISNLHFGWRYFGRNMAREPEAISIPRI